MKKKSDLDSRRQMSVLRLLVFQQLLWESQLENLNTFVLRVLVVIHRIEDEDWRPWYMGESCKVDSDEQNWSSIMSYYEPSRCSWIPFFQLEVPVNRHLTLKVGMHIQMLGTCFVCYSKTYWSLCICSPWLQGRFRHNFPKTFKLVSKSRNPNFPLLDFVSFRGLCNFKCNINDAIVCMAFR